MEKDDLINSLNNILQYLVDSSNGYQLNKNDVSDTRLKSIFDKLCSDRSALSDEIKHKIKELGGSPTDQKTLAGTLHQWYQEIKNAVTGGDPLAISRQIRFGENILIDEYKTVLNEAIPEDIRQILLTQLNKIEEGIKQVDIETFKR